jgi:hypothetical protein
MYVGEEKLGNVRWKKQQKTLQTPDGKSIDIRFCQFVKPNKDSPQGTPIPKEVSCKVRYLSKLVQNRKKVIIDGGKFFRQPALIGNGQQVKKAL